MTAKTRKVKITPEGVKVLYFDSGGVIPGPAVNPQGGNMNTVQNVSPEIQGSFDKVANPFQSIPALVNPVETVGNSAKFAGQALQGVASDLTVQNNFQAQLAPTSQMDYSGLIGQAAGNAAAGYGQSGNLQQAMWNQANLLNQEQMGYGPDPAQAALNRNTGTNIANQAALMGSQRGASSNPALIARQAAQTGANIQQQGVGQEAQERQQQQLNAQQQLQGVYSGIGSQILGEQGANTELFKAGAGASNTQDANLITNYGNSQALNQKTAQANADATNKTMSSLTGGAGAILAMLSKGGEVENPKLSKVSSEDRFPGMVKLPPHFEKMATLYHGQSYRKNMADGGPVKNMGAALKSGGKVPGKAKVFGDSVKNDVVHAALSPGEVVLPRSVMNSADPVTAAAQFVAGLQRKKGQSEAHEGEFKQALKRAISERKSK